MAIKTFRPLAQTGNRFITMYGLMIKTMLLFGQPKEKLLSMLSIIGLKITLL